MVVRTKKYTFNKEIIKGGAYDVVEVNAEQEKTKPQDKDKNMSISFNTKSKDDLDMKLKKFVNFKFK